MILKSRSSLQTQNIASNLALKLFAKQKVWAIKSIGFDLAKKIIKTKPRHNALVIALEGELGAGKTTFVKGFARALGIKSHITSPTFVILRNYQLPYRAEPSGYRSATNYQLLFHIDAYRLRDHHDLIPLGIKEIMADPKNIVLIEWSDRVKKILPKKYIKAHIDHVNKNTRRISVYQIL